jgi:methylmalonyl-CoA epimerase
MALERPPGKQQERESVTEYLGEAMIYNIDHVAIAVHDLDGAIERHRRLYGAEPLSREVVEEQGVDEAMIPVGGSFVQLLMPLSEDSPVGRFLARYGEGLHHIAYAVPDIEAALEDLRSEGARLVDETPRSGGRGAKIAFVHPAAFAGTLVELVELPDE